MKLIRVVLLSFLFVSVALATEAKRKMPCNHVSIISMKRDVFYFKVDTEFMGSTAQVFDSHGEMQYSVEIHSKRALIDFFYMQPGEYTIKFSHGTQVEEHHYHVAEKGEKAGA
jgi:hypothetical protein